jgi:hypothetical protein
LSEFTAEFNGSRYPFSGRLRVVESSHRGLPEWGWSRMAGNLYVGKSLFEALKNG